MFALYDESKPITDVFMHKVGLHGRAVIPLVAAGGCSVPAVLGTRALGTMRERIIASTLACMVPCSARTAVIAGAVALFVSWKAALGIYVVAGGLIVLAGWGLNRILPGASSGLGGIASLITPWGSRSRRAKVPARGAAKVPQGILSTECEECLSHTLLGFE